MSEAHWTKATTDHRLSCGHSLRMNRGYSQPAPGDELYCLRCMVPVIVCYPLMETAKGEPLREYWWRCTVAHCRYGKPRLTGQSSQLAIRNGSLHLRDPKYRYHRVHVVDQFGRVIQAFGQEQEAYDQEPLPF